MVSPWHILVWCWDQTQWGWWSCSEIFPHNTENTGNCLWATPRGTHLVSLRVFCCHLRHVQVSLPPTSSYFHPTKPKTCEIWISSGNMNINLEWPHWLILISYLWQYIPDLVEQIEKLLLRLEFVVCANLSTYVERNDQKFNNSIFDFYQ